MGDSNTLSYKTAFIRGKRELQRHNNECALKYFERALTACPVSSKKELTQILYYLGSTLNKLGMRDCAIKSWVSAGKLDKNGYAARSARRYANAYGMAKQQTTEEDDWKAFYSVHMYRYLRTKKTRRLGTDAERDMIEELIYDAWMEVANAHKLCELDIEAKMRIFRDVRVVFPAFHVPTEDMIAADMISVDFLKKRKLHADDHCFCGSGLPFMICCGRLPGKNELLSGLL